MTSLMVMPDGWQRHLRVLFRAFAASLALAVAVVAAHERPDVVVILGSPPTATASGQSPRAPMPVAAQVQASRRLAATHVSAPRSVGGILKIDRLGPLAPPDLHPHRPGPPLYLAHLRILC